MTLQDHVIKGSYEFISGSTVYNHPAKFMFLILQDSGIRHYSLSVRHTTCRYWSHVSATTTDGRHAKKIFANLPKNIVEEKSGK